MTPQGHPRAIFSRAIEHGNLVVAEQVAREVTNLTLEEALRLLFLYAEKDPIKYERAALRWLARYATGGKAVTLLKVQLAASALAELRAGERQHAAKPSWSNSPGAENGSDPSAPHVAAPKVTLDALAAGPSAPRVRIIAR